MSQYYRMTPRRRAALRKAQLASARKRRRQQIKRVAGVVGAVAATAAVYGLQQQANSLVTHPIKTVEGYKAGAQRIGGMFGRSKAVADPGAPKVVRRLNTSPLARTSVRRSHAARHVAGRRITSRARI